MFFEETQQFANNFVLSDGLLYVLKNRPTYLTSKHALKPMHIIRYKDGVKFEKGEQINLAWRILDRQVRRDRHVMTRTNGIHVSAATIGVDNGKDGVIDVPFLHIFVNPPVKVYEKSPTLYFSSVSHLTSDHWHHDGELPDDAIILVHLIGGSLAYPHKVEYFLWTDDPVLKGTPKFVVYPSRYGNIKIEHPTAAE